MEHANGHNWHILQQFFSVKIAVKLISIKFFCEKIYVQDKHKENKSKSKSIKPKLL